jgi:8-oxo-dGTP pyrophosphatase MutT (NUDIX family)
LAADAELVEHVSTAGEVIEVVTRSELRRRRLRHRCTYIVAVTTDQRVVVHRRAKWKDVFPDYWDLCFGGICGVGESWERAAERELLEESGLAGDLVDLGPVAYEISAPTGPIIGRVFLLVTDAIPTCPDGEVVELDWVSLADLDAWLASRPVCPDSSAVVPPLLRRWYAFR